MKRATKGLEERDVATKHHRRLQWRPGEVAAIKRRMRRRERKQARTEIRREAST